MTARFELQIRCEADSEQIVDLERTRPTLTPGGQTAAVIILVEIELRGQGG